MVKIYLSFFFSIISIFSNDPDTIIFKSIENYLEADIEKINILFISIKHQELFIIKEKKITTRIRI